MSNLEAQPRAGVVPLSLDDAPPRTSRPPLSCNACRTGCLLTSHFSLLTSSVLRYATLGVILLVCFVGCGDKTIGPKRADHQAAHAARYHPDVVRTGPHQTEVPATQATQPDSVSGAWPGTADTAGPVGCPVLFVNAQTITVQEVLEPIIDDLQKQAASLSLQAYVTSMQQRIVAEIDRLIGMVLVYEEANKHTPEKANEPINKEVDRQVKAIINDRFGGVHAKYEAHLKQLGLSLDDVKDRLRRGVVVREFLHERFYPRLREPTRRELMKYYETHLAELTTPAKAELFLIEIPLEAELGKPLTKATQQEKVAARQRAVQQLQRAREELDSGVSFAAVARHYSKGLMKEQGGAWGQISPGALAGRWAKAAEVLFTLQPGEVSSTTEAEETVFIVKCGQRTPAQQQSFEEAQRAIADRLKDEQFEQLSAAYVSELLQRATVRKKPEFAHAVVAAAPRPPVRELTSDEKPFPNP